MEGLVSEQASVERTCPACRRPCCILTGAAGLAGHASALPSLYTSRMGSRFGSQVSRQAFRLPTWSKHHALTFLSSVSVGRDKSGLAAALAASCYLVTFQTVGVGGLSQAQAGLGEEAWPAAEAAGRCSGVVQMGLRDTPHPDPFLRELQGRVVELKHKGHVADGHSMFRMNFDLKTDSLL
ncbi:hypothetical protein AOLI_G00021620 [Acnodon oligacanthus]